MSSKNKVNSRMKPYPAGDGEYGSKTFRSGRSMSNDYVYTLAQSHGI